MSDFPGKVANSRGILLLGWSNCIIFYNASSGQYSNSFKLIYFFLGPVLPLKALSMTRHRRIFCFIILSFFIIASITDLYLQGTGGGEESHHDAAADNNHYDGATAAADDDADANTDEHDEEDDDQDDQYNKTYLIFCI